MTFALMFPVSVFVFTMKINILLQVLSSDNARYGYNAATGKYEDLMAAGIIDPTKASCCAEL